MKNKNIKKQKKAKSRAKAVTKQKNHDGLIHKKYKISYEPVTDEEYPEEIDKQYNKIHDMVYEEPKKAISYLQELKTKYPNVPILYNWLAIAQSNVGDFVSCEITIKENYERNPDYLFAKLNYAEICLHKGRLDEIPIIFDGNFDLSFLYPNRDTFHISEVINFFGFMAIYRVDIGEIDLAKTYYKLIKQLAPEHIITKRVEQKISNKRMENLALNIKKFLSKSGKLEK
ncbi:MAG: hypothetical protein HQK63_17025 [Desulfamplus sp.]|nr:hypothetical protein [Desulfamplus sp.]MBF0389252.1 hypothetical protein [Desulfamplus sp.]